MTLEFTRTSAARVVWLGLVTLTLVPAIAAFSSGMASQPDTRPVPVAEGVSYNRDIRPILTDRCFTCHGPNSEVAKSGVGLRLDSFEGATGALESGGAAIVPGDRARSELLRRVRSTDPDVRMPPPESNLSVSEHEIGLLESWIGDGAQYDTHWAFKPIASVTPPDDESGWSAGAIDRFIVDRLRAEAIEPSPRADRETLIRRVSLDLTGLPPTPEQIDDFLGDTGEGAYARVVDRLLNSPHLGERVGTMWLDASRYADTLGFHHDNRSSQWPWRDWVIGAFNENMPFDRFITEQLAGDLLPDPTLDQRVATAFSRNHPMTDEGGAIDEEYLAEYAADRVATTSTAFLGLTMSCARCHDHKYDPISTDDYYSMFAFFNSVEESGLNVMADGLNFGAFPPFIPVPSAMQSMAIDELVSALDEANASLDEPIEGLADELARWESGILSEGRIEWAEVLVSGADSTGPSELTVLADGSVLAGGEDPDTDVYEITLRTDEIGLNTLRLDALTDESLPMGRAARAPHGNAVLSEIEATAVSVGDMNLSKTLRFVHAWVSHEQQNGDFGILRAIDGNPETGWAPAGHTLDGGRLALFMTDEPFGFEGGTEISVRLRFESKYTKHALGRVRVAPGRATDSLRGLLPVIWREWFSAAPFNAGTPDQTFDRYFGPEGVHRVRPEDRFESVAWEHRPDLVDGQVHTFEGERRAVYYGRQIISPTARSVEASLGSDDALRVWLNGELLLSENVRRGPAPDQNRVTLNLRPGENTLVCKVINDGGPGGFYFRADVPETWSDELAPIVFVPEPDREPSEAARMADQFRRARSPVYLSRVQRAELAQSRLDGATEAIPNVMVMIERDQPRATYVLNRGAYDQPMADRPVSRRPPAVLGSIAEGAPTDRLGLAGWMTDGDNPLVARVAVNRFWHMVFGAGIVLTVENFGTQGAWPSHPELLDWLASDFRDNGWDVKRLLRQIVTSSTYQQASNTRPELDEIDQENRLLARFPRERLPAEHVRDQALAVSGLLNDTIGGPPVRPYQPDGIWRERAMLNSNTRIFEPDSGDALYRRGMYTFWKRSAPSPQMTTFDAPEREFCVVRRSVTNTPLQALVLLNDVTYLEIARALAQRVIIESRESGGQADSGGGEGWRISRAFRICTGRAPQENELDELAGLYRNLLDQYRSDPGAADELLSYGQSSRDDSIDSAEHAAMTMIASVILNLDETITRD